jgi:hypothetical protein
MKGELVERLCEKERRFWHNGEEPASPDSIFGEAADRILSLQSQLAAAQDKLARAEEALGGANTWLENHASHVGSCVGGSYCQCGLTFYRFETATTLAALREPAAEEGRG